MEKITIFMSLICSILFSSCSVPDKDSPMFYLWARFYAKGIERRVIYNTEISKYEIPEFIMFNNKLISQLPEINPISTKKYYVNYSIPFEYYINISLLNTNIKEIQFKYCKLYLNKNEYNMFDTEYENIKLSEYIDYYNNKEFSAGKYGGDFFIGYKFIVNNNDEYYYSGFTLGFKELIFDYNINENIEIKYNVILTDINDNIFNYNFEIVFI